MCRVCGLHSLPLNLFLFHTIFVLSVCVRVFLYLSLSFSLPSLFSPVSPHSRLSPSTPSTLAHPFISCFSRTLPIAISQYSVSRSLGSPFSAWVGFSEPKEARKPEKEPCERKKYVNGFTTTFTRCSLAHAHTGHTLDTHTHYLRVILNVRGTQI